MANITSKEELMTAAVEFKECTFPSGRTVAVRTLVPADAKAIQTMMEKAGKADDDMEYAGYCGIVRTLVFAESHERILTDDEVPFLEEYFGAKALGMLLEAMNEINDLPQLSEQEDEPDPVKKPELGLSGPTDLTAKPASVSPLSPDLAQPSSPNKSPFASSSSGKTSSTAKTREPTIAQP